MLQAKGYLVDGLHGDMSQSLRNRVMNSFRNKSIKVLVATDVAARGIDVDDIEAVFNYDIPQDEEYYVHRIGRTGRAGKTGKAFSFAYGRSLHRLREIQRYTKIKIKSLNVPSEKDVNTKRMESFLGEINDILEQGNLSDYVPAVEELIARGYTSMEIAAALIKMNVSKRAYSQNEAGAKNNNRDREMIKLFVSAGSKHNIRVRDIVGAITGEAGIPGDRIGSIELLSKHSYVEVERRYAELVIDSLNRCKIKGNKIVAELARAK